MKKLILTLTLLLTVSAFVTAGEKADSLRRRKVEGVLGPFVHNWDVSLGVGVLGTFSYADAGVSKLSPAIDVSLAKWLIPDLGVRAQYSGWAMKATAAKDNWFTGLSTPSEIDVNFHSVHADVMWNLSNSFFDYNPKRFYSLVPFAGFGLVRAGKDGKIRNEFAPSVGIINKFRISDSFDAFAEIRTMFISSAIIGDNLEGHNTKIANAMIGLTYYLGKEKRNFVNLNQVASVIPVVEDLETQNANLLAENQKLRDKEPVVITKMSDPVLVEKYAMPPVLIFFAIDKTFITDKNHARLEQLAEILAKYPKMVCTIDGYADSETATTSYNLDLSQRRADSVRNTLIEQYGVNPDQLVTSDGRGETMDLFRQTRQVNRVVIIRAQE